jgi:hypothetical protein
MTTPRLSITQLLSVILYVLFFAVQLHFRYADLRMIGFNQPATIGVGQDDGQTKVSHSKVQNVYSQFNVKLNKRYLPSDFILVSSVTLSEEFFFPVPGLQKPFLSGALISQTGPVGADRGPPYASHTFCFQNL